LVNDRRVAWARLTPRERLRLVDAEGGSLLLAVKRDGAPFVDWATVFRRAPARIRARFEPRFPHVKPHRLRHSFVTTMLDAGVSLRDVQIAARHADPKTTMRYERARKNLDRHPNYILAAYMASGT
jgi:integrase